MDGMVGAAIVAVYVNSLIVPISGGRILRSGWIDNLGNGENWHLDLINLLSKINDLGGCLNLDLILTIDGINGWDGGCCCYCYLH